LFPKKVKDFWGDITKISDLMSSGKNTAKAFFALPFSLTVQNPTHKIHSGEIFP